MYYTHLINRYVNLKTERKYLHIIHSTIVNGCIITHCITFCNRNNCSCGESRKQYFTGKPGYRGYTSPQRLELRTDRPRCAQDSGTEFTVACQIGIRQLNNISNILSFPFVQKAFRAYLDAVDMRAAQVCDGNYTVNYVEKQFYAVDLPRARIPVKRNERSA